MKINLPLIAMLAIVIGAFFFYSHGFRTQSLIDLQPTCTFSASSDTSVNAVRTCVYNITVPADRALSSVKIDTRFESIPGSTFGSRTQLQPVGSTTGKTQTTSGYNDITAYMYVTPAEWKNVEEVKVEAAGKASSTCGNSEYAQAYTEVYDSPVGFNGQGFISCDSQNVASCPANWEVRRFYNSNGNNNFAYRGTQLGQISYGRCAPSTPNVIAYGNVTAIIPHQSIFNNRAIIVVGQREYTAGGAVNVENQPLYASYSASEYPSDVSYYVTTQKNSLANAKFVETLKGSQSGNKTLLDVADTINSVCGRPNNGAACTVSIILVSKTGGKLWIEDSNVQKLNVATAPKQPDPTTVTTMPVPVTVTPIPVTTGNNTPVVTPVPTPTDVGSNTYIFYAIVGGILIIGGYVLTSGRKRR